MRAYTLTHGTLYVPEIAVYTLDRNIVAFAPSDSWDYSLEVSLLGETLRGYRAGGIGNAVVDFSDILRRQQSYGYEIPVTAVVTSVWDGTSETTTFNIRLYHGKSIQGRNHQGTDYYALPGGSVIIPTPTPVQITGGDLDHEVVTDPAVALDADDGCDTTYHVDFGRMREKIINKSDFQWWMDLTEIFFSGSAAATFHATDPAYAAYDGQSDDLSVAPVTSSPHEWTITHSVVASLTDGYIIEPRLMTRHPSMLLITTDVYDANSNVIGYFEINHQAAEYRVNICDYFYAENDGLVAIEWKPDGTAVITFASFTITVTGEPMLNLGMYGLPSAIGGRSWIGDDNNSHDVVAGHIAVDYYTDDLFALGVVELPIENNGGKITAVFDPSSNTHDFDVIACTAADTPEGVTDFNDSETTGWSATVNIDGGGDFADTDLNGAPVAVEYKGAAAFSINANGDKVAFSSGNLQYQASTGKWRLAPQQWESIGAANSNISPTYSGWIDLFGYGTSGVDNGQNAFMPYALSTNSADYINTDLTGTKDWGYAYSQQEGGSWRTLTYPEWQYLLFTRSGNRFAKIQIDSQYNCLVVFPDGYTTTLNNVNTISAAFTGNMLTIAQAEALSVDGCVILPCTYNRVGTTINVGDFGEYSTSSLSHSNNSIFLRFNDTNAQLTNSYTAIGRAVRLVQDGGTWNVRKTYTLDQSGAKQYFAFAPCNFLWIDESKATTAPDYYGWTRYILNDLGFRFGVFSKIATKMNNYYSGAGGLSQFYHSSPSRAPYVLTEGVYCDAAFVPDSVCTGDILIPDGSVVSCGASVDIAVHGICPPKDGGGWLYYIDADGSEQYYPCKIVSRTAETTAEEFPLIGLFNPTPSNVALKVRERVVVALLDVLPTFHIEDVLFSPIVQLGTDGGTIDVAVITTELTRSENVRDFTIELLTTV